MKNFAKGVSKDYLNSKPTVRNFEGGRVLGDIINLEDCEFNPEFEFTGTDGRTRKVAGFVQDDRMVIGISAFLNKSSKLDESKSELMSEIRECETMKDVLDVLAKAGSVKVIETAELDDRFNRGQKRTICLWDKA